MLDSHPKVGHFLVVENIIRRLVRVFKLYRGFIFTKKRGNNPQKISGNPFGPLRFLFWVSKISIKYIKYAVHFTV
jgi:hypothetical protein